MRVIIILAMAIVLESCSIPTAAVRSQVVSYDDAIEDVTNKLLVLNILRAKDKAPLHFDEIPSIHETIQATGSLSFLIPYGPRPPMWSRNSMAPGLNLQVSPSFEIDHLDTKDFVTGIASPIDPKFVKYWLDRGLDRRIVLLLFFSAADIVETDTSGVRHTIRIKNSPREAIDTFATQAGFGDLPEEQRCDALSEFQHYLKLIDSLKTFTARAATERRLLVDHAAFDSQGEFKDINTLASLDPSKFQWVRHSDNTYSIFATSSEPKTALCFSDSPINVGPNARNQQNACVQSVVDIESSDDSASHIEQSPMPTPPIARADKPSDYCAQFNRFIASLGASESTDKSKSKIELRLEIRSVGEIIQFLGDLLEYQEQLAKFFRERPGTGLKLNYPVTFGFCAQSAVPGCADVFFNLRHDSCNARFTLSYRNRRYSVPNYNPPESGACSSEEPIEPSATPANDHTLEVLAVVHQLVDLQKSAQDIKQTPYVQLLP